MAKTNQRPKVEQDTFDRATIKVIHELQKLGFCKNISQIEDYLQLGPRKLQQALYGERHVSRTFRSVLLTFFTNNYHVNPRVFSNITEPVFKEPPPTLEEQPEDYFTKNPTNVISMGDFANMERMKKEIEDKDLRIKELMKELKYWRNLAKTTVMNGGKLKKKTDTKTDKRKKGRR
jgi:hypothetical protein